jgi:6-pyruvoyltetrahydropterin/6-carboxytetrahydropterin synthase
MRTCTRRLEFDAAHRVMEHESRCRNLHGHRYVAEVTIGAERLDGLGRVLDFGVIKDVVGTWINLNWDHGCILNPRDQELVDLCTDKGWRLWTPARLQTATARFGDIATGNPTVENMAEWLWFIARELLAPCKVSVLKVKIWETPNCSAEYESPEIMARLWFTAGLGAS